MPNIMEHASLWEKIRLFPLDDPKAPLTFTQRLARENGWTLEYAVQAVMEYKKFIFLVCTTAHPLTPSDQVDQVWHLHLIYTQSYWEEFCGKILGKSIHHGPTKGGKDETSKYSDWYALCKQRYQEAFGNPPPQAFWPPSAIRFTEINFLRVNTHRYWVIPNFIYWLRGNRK